jgi:hypothetical protein
MKLLKETPLKYEWHTEYLCGLVVSGGWATRAEEHKEFINTKIGKYILKLESKIKN